MQKRNTNRPIHLCLTLSQDSYAAHFLELFKNYKYPKIQTMLINTTKKLKTSPLIETPL